LGEFAFGWRSGEVLGEVLGGILRDFGGEETRGNGVDLKTLDHRKHLIFFELNVKELNQILNLFKFLTVIFESMLKVLDELLEFLSILNRTYFH
jgi:hypothetical protein